MKRLMILTAIVAVACTANAGSFIWGFGGGAYTDHTGADYTDGTALLFLGTVTASESGFNTSAATLIATAGYDANWYSYGNVDTDNLSSSDAVSGTSGITYSLVLVEKSGVTTLDNFEGYYTLTTGTSTEGAIPGATTTLYADMVNYDAMIQTSNQMSAVPEPTSGLLILLGMAGLALKRKRM